MKLDLKALKDADGKPIDTSKIDPTTLALVSGVVAALPDAADTDAITESVREKLGEQFSAIETKIGDLSKKLGEGKPSGDPKKTKDDDGPLAQIQELLGGLSEKITKLESDRDAERQGATVKQVASAYVEANYPNLKAKDRLTARLVAAGVKDEKEAKSVAESVLDEWRDAGVDVDRQLSASPSGEGGKTPEGDDAAEEKRKKLEELKNRKPVIQRA